MDYKRVLMLHFTNGMSSREIAATTGDGKSAVSEFLKRFRECSELSYSLSEDITNEFIAGLLCKKAGNLVNGELYRDFDPEEVHRALAKKGETLKHLWKKYKAIGIVNGRRPLSYRQFCRRYANWLDSSNVTFHIQRYPGINTELNYAGKTLSLHDRCDPKAIIPVTVFVAALSFSDLFYLEGIDKSALTENLVTSNKRRYNDNVVEQLLSFRFAEERLNVGVYGITEAGKSYFMSAFCNEACRRNDRCMFVDYTVHIEKL